MLGLLWNRMELLFVSDLVVLLDITQSASDHLTLGLRFSM